MVDRTNWWRSLAAPAAANLAQVWIAVGLPGFVGEAKAERRARWDARFGADGWRLSHAVRGRVVSFAEAILEYEAAYRTYLRARPHLVEFLAEACGNVYDSAIENVHDDDYEQPHTASNHYQDISVRRVIAELADDPAWPGVTPTEPGEAELVDLGTGRRVTVPRAYGFRGDGLLQIREPDSPGFMLSPAVVPVHDPDLITTLPNRAEWYHHEGIAHLSVEAFWQMSKVVEVRLDRFLELGDDRTQPLAGL